jgi:hypothetical protein
MDHLNLNNFFYTVLVTQFVFKLRWYKWGSKKDVKIRNFLILILIFNINMTFYFSLQLLIMFLFQTTDEMEVFNFILVFFGIILLIIILAYILITSKQEK